MTDTYDSEHAYDEVAEGCELHERVADLERAVQRFEQWRQRVDDWRSDVWRAMGPR